MLVTNYRPYLIRHKSWPLWSVKLPGHTSNNGSNSAFFVNVLVKKYSHV